MRTEKIRIGLLKLEYFLGAAIVICQLFSMQKMSSWLFYGTFFVTFFLWIMAAVERMDRLDLLMLSVAALSLVNILVNGVLENADFSFQYMKKWMMFCTTLLYFCVMSKIEIDKKTLSLLKIIYMVIGALLVFLFFTQTSRMYMINGRISTYLTFGFSNPNLTALFLGCMIMFFALVGSYEKKVLWKICCFMFAAVEIFFVSETESRNVLLALVVFFTVIILRKTGFVTKLRMGKAVSVIVVLFPLIFVIVYMLVIDLDGINELFSFMVGEGKQLSSRVKIWKPALDAFRQSPLFGAYFQISDGTGESQMHNSHLDVLVSYGVVAFAVFCYYIYSIMQRIKNRENYDQIAFIAFICTFLLGIGEAAMFSGGLGIYLYAGIFLALANSRLKDG